MASRSSQAANTKKAAKMGARIANDLCNAEVAMEYQFKERYVVPSFGAPAEVGENWIRKQAIKPFSPANELEVWGLAQLRKYGIT